MVYQDPYILDPGTQRTTLGRMLGGSFGFHVVLIFMVLHFVPREVITESPSFDPSQVIHVDLMSAMARPDNRLPEKVTTAPDVPEAVDDQAVSLPDETADTEVKPPEPEPEPEKPKPPEEPREEKRDEAKPEPQPDQAKLDQEAKERLAALTAKYKQEQPNKGDPNAAQGTKTRPQTSTDGQNNANGANLSFSESSPEGRYLAEVKAQVVDAWIVNKRLKKEQPDLTVVIEVTLLPTGILDKPTIAVPSGNDSYDQSALRAVKIVANDKRFQAPPPKLKDQTVGFVFRAGEAK